MPTLILPPRYTEDSIALWQSAGQLGWACERLQGWKVPDWLSRNDLVLYGEPLFAAVVADQLGLALLEPPFHWLPSLPEHYRKRAVELRTLADARGITAPMFIKPADDKCFPARVYASGHELPGIDVLPPKTPVLLAEPVVWEIEVRCFVQNREVKTYSPYLRSGVLAKSPDGEWPMSEAERQEALAFALSLLEDSSIPLPPAMVVDVGRIADRGWAVVEVNAAWGSGIYGCDPDAVLETVRRACVPKSELTENDKAWIVDRAGSEVNGC